MHFLQAPEPWQNYWATSQKDPHLSFIDVLRWWWSWTIVGCRLYIHSVECVNQSAELQIIWAGQMLKFWWLKLVLYNFDQLVSHTSQRGQKIRFDPRFHAQSLIRGSNFLKIWPRCTNWLKLYSIIPQIMRGNSHIWEGRGSWGLKWAKQCYVPYINPESPLIYIGKLLIVADKITVYLIMSGSLGIYNCWLFGS